MSNEIENHIPLGSGPDWEIYDGWKDDPDNERVKVEDDAERITNGCLHRITRMQKLMAHVSKLPFFKRQAE